MNIDKKMMCDKSVSRVLLIGEMFFPMDSIGAIRPTKLARYLQKEGYAVDVFTTPELSKQLYHVDGGYRVVSTFAGHAPEQTIADHKQPASTKIARKRGKLLTQMAMTRRQWLQYRKSAVFVKQFKASVASGIINLESYDCIFTTFGPVGAILAGLEAKKMHPGLRWICDFRDPMVSQIMPKLFAPFYQHIQSKSIRTADCVTTVSHGYKKRIMRNRDLEKCIVIPNGFDDDDRISGALQEDDKFSFAYVGSLYEGKRDLSLLFQAIREMIDAGTVDMDKIRFHYAGGEMAFLRGQAQKYGLEGILEDHGQMTHEACLALQASVRFLVMSTWNEKGEEGVFPGKLIEYMLMKKPVINITNGKLPNCEVTQVIRELDLGVSCEEADGHSYTALKRWLDEQSRAFLAGNTAIFNPKAEEIEARYNWKNIVKRFGELIDG